MPLLDTITSVIAPHICISCGREGSVLCTACLRTAGDPPPPRCAGCKKLTKDYKTCKTCRAWLDVYAVYVATDYSGIYEQLVRSYKFDVQRQAAEPMVSIMQQTAPGMHPVGRMYLCPLPTAPSRIRQRGFDHAWLLAQTYLSRSMRDVSGLQLELTQALRRTSNTRQLGSSRDQRIKQMEHELSVADTALVVGRTFFLIDDVTTTGASLAAAAKALKAAGARRVYATVFAQKV